MATANNNYTLGKGQVFLASFLPGTQNPDAFMYVGNTPELSVKISTKTLDHYSADGGIKEKDQQVITDVDRAGTLSTDNLSRENLAKFFLGSKTKVTKVSTPVTAESLTGSAVKGGVYLLGDTTANAMGARGVDPTTVVVKKGATTYVRGTDYIVDGDRGTVEILTTGAIADGDALTVDYTIKASTHEGFISGSTPFEGALLFVATNVVGEKVDYLLPWVKLNPDGDYNLKSDSWIEMKFSLEVLKATGKEAFYANGLPAYS